METKTPLDEIEVITLLLIAIPVVGVMALTLSIIGDSWGFGFNTVLGIIVFALSLFGIAVLQTQTTSGARTPYINNRDTRFFVFTLIVGAFIIWMD